MFMMFRYLSLLIACVALSTVHLGAQGVANYREFALGASVQTVATLAQRGAAPVQTDSLRPALIQTMVWRRPYLSTDNQPALRDPVKQMEFSFYDDQLYRIVIDYDSDRTRGLTTVDFVDALSAIYGPMRLTAVRTTTGGVDDGTNAGRIIGQWGDDEVSVVAYQETDFYVGPTGLRFKLIVASPRLAALSRTAATQSARQDEREAPQREIARRKKQADDERAAQDKARVENRAAFRP